jgi:hypothetical protein
VQRVPGFGRAFSFAEIKVSENASREDLATNDEAIVLYKYKGTEP